MDKRCLDSYGYAALRKREKEEDVEYEEMSVYGIKSSTTVLLESGVWATADSVGKERRINVIYEAKKVVAGSQQKCELKRFAVETRELVE